MAPKGRADWTRMVFILLEREGPLDIEYLIREGMPLVPPGQAWRAGEARRLSVPNAREKRTVPRSDDQIIRTGARYVVGHSIASMVQRGHLVREGSLVLLPEHVRERALRERVRAELEKPGSVVSDASRLRASANRLRRLAGHLDEIHELGIANQLRAEADRIEAALSPSPYLIENERVVKLREGR